MWNEDEQEFRVEEKSTSNSNSLEMTWLVI